MRLRLLQYLLVRPWFPQQFQWFLQQLFYLSLGGRRVFLRTWVFMKKTHIVDNFLVVVALAPQCRPWLPFLNLTSHPGTPQERSDTRNAVLPKGRILERFPAIGVPVGPHRSGPGTHSSILSPESTLSPVLLQRSLAKERFCEICHLSCVDALNNAIQVNGELKLRDGPYKTQVCLHAGRSLFQGLGSLLCHRIFPRGQGSTAVQPECKSQSHGSLL